MDKIIGEMIKKAHGALAHAYAPYSKFTVGACICTDRDHLYTGVNVENGSYGLTTCAEVGALCAMVSSGEQIVKSIVILAGNNLLCPPCGACRQRIHEFSLPDTQVYLCNKDGVLQCLTLQELFPLAFNFKPQ